MRFSDLPAGYTFPADTPTLDPMTVQRYLAATDDDNALYWRDGAPRVVPPLAVAALSLRAIAAGVSLAPGSIHSAQDLAFHRVVAVGETLQARARVVTASKRRDFTALAIESTVGAADTNGEPAAISGRMTLFAAPGQAEEPRSADEGTGTGAGARLLALPDTTEITTTPAPMRTRAYPLLSREDIVAGAEIPPLERTVTQGRIDAYALASGDHNPIHLDPDFAAATPFGGTIAHGMLLLAYASAALARAFGLAWLETGSLKVRFRNPAPAGTMVTARGRVKRLEPREHSEEDSGVQYAICAILLQDPHGASLITGEARVAVLAPTVK